MQQYTQIAKNLFREKKSFSKACILYDSVYIDSRTDKTNLWLKKITKVVALRRGRTEDRLGRGMRELSGG